MKKIKSIPAIIFCSLIISLFPIAPANGCACGMLVAEVNKEIQMSGEQGAVVFDNSASKEQLAIYFDLSGTSMKSALVVPTPKQAKLSQIKKSVFDDLKDIAYPKPVFDGMVGAIPGAVLNTGSVQVLERKKVGSFEIAALKADTYRALYEWTRDNGFNLEPESEAPIRTYIDNNFVLNVIKLKKNAKESEINPLFFTFETEHLFYPLMTIKDVRDPYKDKNLTLFLLTEEKIDIPFTDILNRPLTADSLKADISNTTEKDFSNLEFNKNNYYLSTIKTSNYSKDQELSVYLGNPLVKSYQSSEIADLVRHENDTRSQIRYLVAIVSVLVNVILILFILNLIFKSKRRAMVTNRDSSVENIET